MMDSWCVNGWVASDEVIQYCESRQHMIQGEVGKVVSLTPKKRKAFTWLEREPKS